MKRPAVRVAICVIGPASIDNDGHNEQGDYAGASLGSQEAPGGSLVHGPLLAEELALSIHGAGMDPAAETLGGTVLEGGKRFLWTHICHEPAISSTQGKVSGWGPKGDTDRIFF